MRKGGGSRENVGGSIDARLAYAPKNLVLETDYVNVPDAVEHAVRLLLAHHNVRVPDYEEVLIGNTLGPDNVEAFKEFLSERGDGIGTYYNQLQNHTWELRAEFEEYLAARE